jgi:2-haloacid dehalogenase
MAGKDGVKALVFDVFGTVVDWRASCIRELTAFGRGRGITGVDWDALTDDWRGLYQPSMEEVRSGRRSFVTLDQLHRESLTTLLHQYGMPPLAGHEVDHLVTIWHRLSPWPDVVEGLYRLKRRYILGTLSNGNIGLMTRLAKHGGLPWDVILGAELAQSYKPMAEVYLRSADALNLEPRECMMVAAHNGDLSAASELGFRTGFVLRPNEYGPNQLNDTSATSAWDVVTDSFHGLADALGCPRY